MQLPNETWSWRSGWHVILTCCPCCPTRAGQHVINDQVQGGAPSYRHNLRLLELFGFKPTPVHMRIAFGVGDKQWTNHRWAGGRADAGEGGDGWRWYSNPYWAWCPFAATCHVSLPRSLSDTTAPSVNDQHAPAVASYTPRRSSPAALHLSRPPARSPSDLTSRLQPEITRFGRVLKWIKRLEPIFVFVPIDTVSHVGCTANAKVHP